MFGTVPTIARHLDDYLPVVGPECVNELRSMSRGRDKLRVTALTGRSFGSSESEEIRSIMPLLAELGFTSDWQVMRSSNEFHGTMEKLEPALRGQYPSWLDREGPIWRRYTKVNADLWEDVHDLVLVTGFEPVGVRLDLENRLGVRPRAEWIWRDHADVASLPEEMAEFFSPYLEAHDARLIVAPGIDPATTRNAELSEAAVAAILFSRGIVAARPILCQVGSSSGASDALAAIDLWQALRTEVGGLQLVLAGWNRDTSAAECIRRAQGSVDIHLIPDAGSLEINALQRSATVILEMTSRISTGLEVIQAGWKSRPVVTGPHPPPWGLLRDGETGFLGTSLEDAAQKALALLRDPDRAEDTGRRAREHVFHHFLITRVLYDYLQLFAAL